MARSANLQISGGGQELVNVTSPASVFTGKFGHKWPGFKHNTAVHCGNGLTGDRHSVVFAPVTENFAGLLPFPRSKNVLDHLLAKLLFTVLHNFHKTELKKIKEAFWVNLLKTKSMRTGVLIKFAQFLPMKQCQVVGQEFS